MAENLSLSLQITLIGMSLVFGSILLLWLVMSVLVRLTGDKQTPGAEPETAEAGTDDREIKQRAAAAAVALALAYDTQAEPRVFPLPPTAIVSAWQTVMRGTQLKQRGPIRRK